MSLRHGQCDFFFGLAPPGRRLIHQKETSLMSVLADGVLVAMALVVLRPLLRKSE
ncbi:DUF3927 family protein [Escherichia coli]|uniref:DUF3927 family protein n=1 Tax=Escherichia coli TaxID=562 RepID=UPI0029164B7A|nr:DUF3927 family protein [Escherichia coli]MDD7238647.1 DUF3927 family protein [Escherichia coli]MDZ8648423.1 DUF3927 family protein [Escherichia coli]MDZ8995637.1 DUF3927 family protein [Escherichia coli]